MPPEPPPRRERVLFLAGAGGAAVLAAFLRAPGLAPRCLYLDDVWAALFAREASFPSYLALRPPHPAGFLALESLALRVLPGAEVAVQAIPFAASLALVLLGAWLFWRRTGDAAGATFAAVLLALNPTLSDYSVHAKPYATDSLLSLALAAMVLKALDEPSPRRVGLLALAAAPAVAFSYPAALVGSVGFAVALAAALASGRNRPRLAGIALAFFAAEAALAALLVLGQTNAQLASFWRTSFVPLGHATEALGFVASNSVLLLAASFPRGWWALGLLPPLGLALLLSRRETRLAGAYAGALWVSLFAAAALRLYPVDARTASFAYAFVALLTAWTVSSQTRRAASPFVRQGVPALLAAAVVVSSSRPVVYPGFDDARLVRALVAEAKPEDAVLVYPHANWAVGYYSGWPVRLVKAEYYGTRFEARPLREGTTVLPGLPGYEERPEVLDPALREALSRRPPRVLYLATHLEISCCTAHLHVLKSLRDAGYAAERLAVAHGGEVLRFTRARQGFIQSIQGTPTASSTAR